MTTATPRSHSAGGLGVLLGAVSATLAVGVGCAVTAALTSGGNATTSVLAGLGLAVGVFAFGAFAVHVVADARPEASLLVALLTYTLQVAVMLALFVSMTSAGTFDGTLDRSWFGAAIIAAAMGWTVAQIVLTTRVRIPLYDLPDRALEGSER